MIGSKKDFSANCAVPLRPPRGRTGFAPTPFGRPAAKTQTTSQFGPEPVPLRSDVVRSGYGMSASDGLGCPGSELGKFAYLLGELRHVAFIHPNLVISRPRVQTVYRPAARPSRGGCQLEGVSFLLIASDLRVASHLAIHFCSCGRGRRPIWKS
jgi:hypothetical protein